MRNEQNKSQHGNNFKEQVLGVLIEMQRSGRISRVESSKTIQNAKGIDQFYAPFYAENGRGRFAIFSTTSARSDRIKINQWDANGIKLSLGQGTVCILVLPDNLSENEERHYLNEAERISEEGYVSALDRIIKLEQLEEVF